MEPKDRTKELLRGLGQVPDELLRELESRVAELAHFVKALRQSDVSAGDLLDRTGLTVEPMDEQSLGPNGDRHPGEGVSVKLGVASREVPRSASLATSGVATSPADETERASLSLSVTLDTHDGSMAPGDTVEPQEDKDEIEATVAILRATLESMSEGILAVDLEGAVTTFNQRFIDLWGLPEKILESRDNGDWRAFLAERLRNPQNFLSRIKQLDAQIDEEASDVFEFKDGKLIAAESRPQRLNGILVGRQWKFREVTETKRAEERPWESEPLCGILAESSRLGVIACDRKGQITATNPVSIDILGLPDEEAAKAVSLLRHPSMTEAGISIAVGRCLESGEPFCGEFSLKKKSGPQTHLRLHLFPSRSVDGRIESLQCIMDDISGQKRAEELVLQSQRLNVLGQMATGVCHTFSNVLQIISGNANMAFTNLELEEYEEIKLNLEQILESSRCATEAVRRLQQFARERPHKEAPKKVVFDLSDAVSQGVEMCKLWSKAKLESEGIEISQEIDLTRECHIEGDPDQMATVVLNLLKNAVEALPQGGKISVKTFIKEDQVVLTVQDNGVGIRDEDISNISAAFWTSKESHAGMGLAFNCDVIRQHGGHMGVKRMKPRGTAFSVKLPRTKQPPRPISVVAEKAADRTYSLLLIDDECAVVNILGKGLRKRGNTTFIAGSGQEGLAILQQNRVDAVICDLGMEGMSGWDVSGAISSLCVEKDIPRPPFILLTGWAGQITEDELDRHPDVDRIVEKPVTIPALLQMISHEVRKAQSVHI